MTRSFTAAVFLDSSEAWNLIMTKTPYHLSARMKIKHYQLCLYLQLFTYRLIDFKKFALVPSSLLNKLLKTVCSNYGSFISPMLLIITLNNFPTLTYPNLCIIHTADSVLKPDKNPQIIAQKFPDVLDLTLQCNKNGSS